jgi:hypothetical protein
MHNARFKEMEATWRALYYLVSRSETGPQLKLRVFNATLKELRTLWYDQQQGNIDRNPSNPGHVHEPRSGVRMVPIPGTGNQGGQDWRNSGVAVEFHLLRESATRSEGIWAVSPGLRFTVTRGNG